MVKNANPNFLFHIVKLLILSEQKSKNQRYSVYHHMRQKKLQILTTEKLELHQLCLKNDLMILNILKIYQCFYLSFLFKKYIPKIPNPLKYENKI